MKKIYEVCFQIEFDDEEAEHEVGDADFNSLIDNPSWWAEMLQCDIIGIPDLSIRYLGSR